MQFILVLSGDLVGESVCSFLKRCFFFGGALSCIVEYKLPTCYPCFHSQRVLQVIGLFILLFDTFLHYIAARPSLFNHVERTFELIREPLCPTPGFCTRDACLPTPQLLWKQH